jgi:hypothetical protein
VRRARCGGSGPHLTGIQAAIAAEEDLEQAIARHLGRPRAARPTGFASRTDAIDLPDDTSPLSVLRRNGHGEPLN